MMLRAFRPAMPSAGKAQKGWIILVHWSPQAMAMAARPASMPIVVEAGMTMGACTAHWPPPEGTKKLMMPADRKVSTGKVTLLEMLVKKSAIIPARDTPSWFSATIRPMMPA